jgi:hypothetical protein
MARNPPPYTASAPRRALILLLLLALAPACRRKDEPRVSHGFDPSLSGPPEKLTPAEQRKLEALTHRAPAVHFPERKATPGALDLYVDEKLRRSLPAKELEQEQPLSRVVGDLHARNVLAHGEAAELWVSAADLPAFGIRLNRRGAIKLERLNQAEGGGGGGKGGGRSEDLRDVQWLEVRTAASPRLPGEP